MSLSPLDAVQMATAKPVAATGADFAKVAKTAQDFEASFLSVMIGQAFTGADVSAPFGGGQGEAAFKSFLTEALGKAMARHGVIGIAKAVSAELLKMQGAS